MIDKKNIGEIFDNWQLRNNGCIICLFYPESCQHIFLCFSHFTFVLWIRVTSPIAKSVKSIFSWAEKKIILIYV